MTSTAQFSLGIDLGTSELKALLLDEAGTVCGQAGQRLAISRPQPGWSEQNPADWWAAAQQVCAELRQRFPDHWRHVAVIGLSGQMHGAVVLDARNRVIRPAILWNDGRADAECRLIEAALPDAAHIAGSRPMAGLTAPKLLWLQRHEPDNFARIACVLSPKDYLRLCLNGERISDPSDGAGTLWLDVAARRWSADLVEASGLRLHQMPALLESPENSGALLPAVAAALGLPAGVPVAAGGGDNPVSALGIGAVQPGAAFVNLGTSAALVVATDAARAAPGAAIHAFCHALPGLWYQMGAMLSGASCLRWVTQLVGAADEAALLRRIDERRADDPGAWAAACADAPIFLPYLSGERTPHNDVNARGVFFGLSHDTDSALLCHAVLEGVCFGLKDAALAMQATGTELGVVSLVGGGARSPYWAGLLASVLGTPVQTLAGSELGGALGAARLGWLALGLPVAEVCTPAAVSARYEPDPALGATLAARQRQYRALYPALAPLFALRAQGAGVAADADSQLAPE
jgi:xylulokinase